MNIGDKQPSELLREMSKLGQSLVDPTVIRSFWVNRLPNQTRIAVSTMLDTADIDKLTILADRIYKIEIASSPNPQVFAVQKSEDVQKKSQQRESRPRERGRSKSRARSSSKSKTEQRGGICYFHWKFADKAYKCEFPDNCKFKKPEN